MVTNGDGKMNNDMKCPFCQQELKEIYCNGICLGLICKNRDCLETKSTLGNKTLWQELIKLMEENKRTRKALDRAKWWLNEIVENHRYTPISTAEIALKEITTLEQKDVK